MLRGLRVSFHLCVGVLISRSRRAWRKPAFRLDIFSMVSMMLGSVFCSVLAKYVISSGSSQDRKDVKDLRLTLHAKFSSLAWVPSRWPSVLHGASLSQARLKLTFNESALVALPCISMAGRTTSGVSAAFLAGQLLMLTLTCTTSRNFGASTGRRTWTQKRATSRKIRRRTQRSPCLASEGGAHSQVQ